MTPVPSPLPLTGPAFLPGISSLAYAVGVLLLVCAAAFVTVKIMYGKGGMNRFGFRKQLIRVIDRYPVASNRYLLTVEIAGKYYLLGVTDQAISMLTQLDSEALSKALHWEEQNTGGFPTPFNSYLTALSRKWKKNKKEPPDGS